MIVLYILIPFVAIALLRYIRDFYKRWRTVRSLMRLADQTDSRITVHKNPYLSIFRPSRRTELTIETATAAYHVRFLTSDGFYKRVVHFATAEYTVSFRYFKYMLLKAFTFVAGSQLSTYQDGFIYGAKVRLLPKHEMVESIPGKPNYDTIIFSPTPHTVSYVATGGTSIRLMRIEDEIFGYKVFTTSLFSEHIRGELIAEGYLDPPKTETPAVDSTVIEREASDEFFATLPTAPPPLEEKVERPPFDPFRLGIVRKRRATVALLSLIGATLLTLLFGAFVFVRLDRDGTLLFIALVLLIGIAIAASAINSRLHFRTAFGKSYIAVVRDKLAHSPRRSNHGVRTYPYKVYAVTDRIDGDTTYRRFVYATHSLVLFIESGSIVHIPVATATHADLYSFSDRVLVIGGMPYPYLISPDKKRRVCPACGHITEDETGGCPECGCIFPSISTDEELKEYLAELKASLKEKKT